MQHGASVITVFSDSRDHHHSARAQQQLTNITLCGCLLIDSNVTSPPRTPTPPPPPPLPHPLLISSSKSKSSFLFLKLTRSSPRRPPALHSTGYPLHFVPAHREGWQHAVACSRCVSCSRIGRRCSSFAKTDGRRR